MLAGRLFGWANQASSRLGLGSLKPSDVATAIAGAGALLSGAGGANQPSVGSTAQITGTAAVTSTFSLASLNLSTLTL